MNKKMKIKKVVAILLLIIMNLLCIQSNIYAIEPKESTVYQVGDCGDLLEYRSEIAKTIYTECNGYPAYRLHEAGNGADKGSYSVTLEDKLQSVAVWRIIANGYPIKDENALGVANKEEAYTATQHAIYCMLDGKNELYYQPFGDTTEGPGARTYKAMRKILSDISASNDVRKSAEIKIDNVGTYIEGEYFVHSYEVTVPSKVQIKNYKVVLSKENGENLGGIKLVDSNGNEKDTFSPQEKFKVLIPIKEMTKNGEYSIKVSTEANTMPVLYATSNKENCVDYVVGGMLYEPTSKSMTREYAKNETKITIIEKDKDTGTMIEGAEFELLDENYNKVLTNIKTNKEGKVVLENMLPGVYYLREVKTADEYHVYPEEIKLELSFGTEIIVKMDKEKRIIEDKSETSPKDSVEIEASETTTSDPQTSENTTQKNQTNNAQTTTTDVIQGQTPLTTTSAASSYKLPVAGM